MQNKYNNSTANLRERVFSSRKSNVVHESFLAHIGKTHKGGKILDIGTGNGYILMEIANRFPDAYVLFGIDSSPDMLKKAESLGGDISYKLADNYNLPFEDGCFSTVTAKNVTRFSPTEVFRILEENGLLVFREYGEGKGLAEIAELFPGRLIRSRNPNYYVSQLKEAGFEEINLEKYFLKKTYTPNELLHIVQMFPFIENLDTSDIDMLRRYFGNNKSVEITSDPFILTARRMKK